jgi:hypothetical protein
MPLHYPKTILGNSIIAKPFDTFQNKILKHEVTTVVLQVIEYRKVAEIPQFFVID